jgi:hypothetical protein
MANVESAYDQKTGAGALTTAVRKTLRQKRRIWKVYCRRLPKSACTSLFNAYVNDSPLATWTSTFRIIPKSPDDRAGQLAGCTHRPKRMSAMTAHIENQTMQTANPERPRRDVAEENVAQANETHEKMSAAATEATRLMKNTYSTTFKGTQEYSTKVLEFACVNTNAAFEYVRQISSVKSPAEFFALSNDRVRQQFEVQCRQAQELAAIARKVTIATTESNKPGVNKAT